MKNIFLLIFGLGFALGINARTPKVIYLSNSEKTGTGQYMDSTVLTELASHGYNVAVSYPTSSSFSWARLDSADLVIIGRIINSGDFTSSNWAAVKAPVFTFSSWAIRNNRLKFVNSSVTNRLTTKTSTVSKDTIITANVSNPLDPAFNGIAISSGKINFLKWFFDFIDVDSTAFATGNNGKLLATANGPGRNFDKKVFAARWSPKVETYAGSGNFPANYRSFIQMGADDGFLPPVRNFVQYTPESYQMIFNELAYLMSVDNRQKVKFTNVTLSQFDVSWANETATPKAVFISASSTGNPEMVNNTTYTANPVFGSGTQAGAGWYCVYNGTGTGVTVTGLSKTTEYRVIVVDYTGSTGAEAYQMVSAPYNPCNQTSADEILTTGITVTGAENATAITANHGTLQMNAVLLPVNATNKAFTWSVNDETIAGIDANGLLSAKKNGTVTVKATANDASGKIGQLDVTISGQLILVTGISVTGADNATTISAMGGQLQMSAVVLPANATNKVVTWSVSNETLAGIDANGLLTAKENGVVTVKATANDATGILGQLDVTITGQTVSLSNGITRQIAIYPNPAQDFLTILNAESSNIEIVNLQGQVLKTLKLQGANKQLNISTLASGIYMLRVGGQVLKFVKK